MAKTNFFRVAVEGATTDGRSIERQWLLEAAQTYNRDTYAARVNMEHIRGITADKPFKAYGDVLALKTEEITLELAGKQEKRLALFAELDVTDELVAINRDKQKLYTSIEISPNFANTGKAYLVGLAVTDSPASLGTEMLTFAAAQGDKNPLASRKQDPANLFSAADEPVTLELEAAPVVNADPTGIFAKVADLLGKFTGAANPPAPVVVPPADPAGTPEAPDAAAFAVVAQALTQLSTQMAQASTDAAARMSKIEADLAKVTTTVEETPATGFTKRPLATGGGTVNRTDC